MWISYVSLFGMLLSVFFIGYSLKGILDQPKRDSRGRFVKR